MFNTSIIESIKKRKSVRTYDNRTIDESIYNEIKSHITAEENLTGPFGKKIKLQLVSVDKNITDKGIKVGTYGIIKNPKGYIVGTTESDNMSLVQYGYVFEKMILFLTQLGLGTCWLGGTFDRKSFLEEINIEQNEIIPAITPIGYSSEKSSFTETSMRLVAGSDKRKSWNELFFAGDFNNSLSQTEDNKFSLPMNMVRIGPSASNKQPWRIVLSNDKEKCHLYLAKTPNYPGNKRGYEMQRIDMGIAMSHFELSCKELNLSGKWVIKNPNIDVPNENTEYIASWENI